MLIFLCSGDRLTNRTGTRLLCDGYNVKIAFGTLVSIFKMTFVIMDRIFGVMSDSYQVFDAEQYVQRKNKLNNY